MATSKTFTVGFDLSDRFSAKFDALFKKIDKLTDRHRDFLPTPEGVRLPLSLTCFCSVSGGSSPQSKGEYVYAGV